MKKSLAMVLVLLGLFVVFTATRPWTGLGRTAPEALQRTDAQAELAAVPRGEPESSGISSPSHARAAIPAPGAPIAEAAEAVASASDDADTQTGALRVEVREQGTQDPARGVTVQIFDYTMFKRGDGWGARRFLLTNDEGVAQFNDVLVGEAEANVLAAVGEGHATGEVVTIRAGVTATLVLEVSPARPVLGHVEDKAGRRIGGAKITDIYNGGAGVIVGESLADGSFELPYQQSWSRLSASYPGYAPSPPEVVTDSGAPIVLRLSPSRGRVFGRVLDPDGDLVGGVQLSLIQFGGQSDPRSQARTSGTDGRFEFQDAIVGDAHLAARLPHGALTLKELRVTDGGQHEVTIQLQTGGTLKGRITKPDGSPWNGARVTADDERYTLLGHSGVETKADGSFELLGQGPGEVTFRISNEASDELAVETLMLYEGKVTEWNSVCAERSPLHGYVHIESGPPLVDWRVLSQPMRGPDAYESWRTGLRTDENGRFEVTPEKGETYRLRVYAPGAGGAHFALEVADVGIEAMPIDLAVPKDRVPTGILTGRLVNPQGHPVSGNVTFVVGDEAAAYLRGKSESDGRFEIQHVPQGPGRLLDGKQNSTDILATVQPIAPGSIVDVGDIVLPEPAEPPGGGR